LPEKLLRFPFLPTFISCRKPEAGDAQICGRIVEPISTIQEVFALLPRDVEPASHTGRDGQLETGKPRIAEFLSPGPLSPMSSCRIAFKDW
jgi:hypothetical protein